MVQNRTKSDKHLLWAGFGGALRVHRRRSALFLGGVRRCWAESGAFRRSPKAPNGAQQRLIFT
eukprot:12361825-Alexandrium_andersonii.AAC.1